MKFYNLLKHAALSRSVPQSSAYICWLAVILAAKEARKDQTLEVAEVLKIESIERGKCYANPYKGPFPKYRISSVQLLLKAYCRTVCKKVYC